LAIYIKLKDEIDTDHFTKNATKTGVVYEVRIKL